VAAVSDTKLTHIDADGAARMVDVTEKAVTARVAVASALLQCTPSTRDALLAGTTKKGEAAATARIAGILAAKQTGTLIPLCHPIALTSVDVDIAAHKNGIAVTATARCVGTTGVEMEAMIAASVAGLTLYDMGKAIERTMVLTAIQLEQKSGGKTGVWKRS
jgi:cyclic pyranopterin monophosphate synthase